MIDRRALRRLMHVSGSEFAPSARADNEMERTPPEIIRELKASSRLGGSPTLGKPDWFCWDLGDRSAFCMRSSGHPCRLPVTISGLFLFGPALTVRNVLVLSRSSRIFSDQIEPGLSIQSVLDVVVDRRHSAVCPHFISFHLISSTIQS